MVIRKAKQLRPESRGHIELGSADPLAPPKMFANYLDAANDRECAVRAISFARKLANTEPMKGLVAEEMKPGPSATTDDAILDFARGNGATIFHPSGTCRMGDDDQSIVDPRLKLRGMEGLWIADCSVMPRLVSGNTNLPAIMIGERAAEMILTDATGG